MAGFFGKKDVKVKVQKDYTADEFYEIIKDHPFAAGKPEKIRYMMMDLIVFPALDKHNQVRIVANAALRGAFGWIADIPRMFGENAKKAVELVDATAKDLEGMNL